jgi:hypothetical protein
MLALGLVLIVFLPTLVFSVSAYAAINDSSDKDHFILYQDQNGDTVCREATALEAQELDKINPTELRPINHLDAISKKGGVRAEDLPQHLTIILRATPNLEANAPAKAAFIRAAQAWENVISSPVTLYIDADVGPDNFGSAWESGVLGATSTPSLNGVNYPTLRATLNAVANTPAKQAVYNALPQSSVPTDAGSGSATAVSVSTSIARAIGLADPTAQPSDSAARIGFNSAVNFDFDSSNGVVGTDFQSVATHEIGHALGFTSRSGSSGNSTPAMWDLYRFRSGTTAGSFATAQRIMTVGGPTTNSQYYFVPGINEIGLSDGGSTPPAQPPFPNNSDGNQSSHWRQASLNGGVFTGYIGIMDPRLPGGITRPITANDTDALGIFGYNANLVVPPPPANDNFANAQTLAGCSGTVTGTNVSATKESGELNHLSTTTDPTGGGSRSVWYQWQAPASGSVTFDTSGSGIDTVLGIYTGNAVNSLAVIGQDDDVVNGTVRTSTITFNATAGTTYKIAVDGYNNGGSGGEVGPIKLNWTASNCIAQLIQISQFFAVNESAAFVTIVITRSGDTAGPASVNYATSDSAGLVSCGVNSGVASERCDYATTVGTAQFAAGVNTASITIPIVHDALVEGDENFTLSLSSPTGGTLASPPTATITIVDNDFAPATQNPFDDIPFFVTQQYIDFLGRLPDATGFNNWVGTLNGCPNGGFGEFDNPGCDRVHVSAGFFLSAEFQGRGYFAYRFYEVALDRRPTYGEFVPDMALVGGPQSPESEVLSKATYTDAWMQRSQFKSRYDALSNSDYVNALEANAEIVVSNKQSLIDALNGGSMNRGQVLRNIVESQAVANQFFNRAFVSMQYFGYLRRDPDTIGFQNWLNTLNADPSNFRHMIFGFLYSTEYRQRFGP